MSESFLLMVGAAQGGPLSILMSDIYIDDLSKSLHSEGIMGVVVISEEHASRALTIANKVECLDNDIQGLQCSIYHGVKWLKHWQLQANQQKSVDMIFHPKEGQSAATPSEYHLICWTLDGHSSSHV